MSFALWGYRSPPSRVESRSNIRFIGRIARSFKSTGYEESVTYEQEEINAKRKGVFFISLEPGRVIPPCPAEG
jgi:hypothetical protein